MPTLKESICCQEIAVLREKMTGHSECITQHPGFRTVCLDIWVLQTAYFQYRQEHGRLTSTIQE